MSQKNVEIAIGRVVTDEDERQRLRASPRVWVAGLAASGLELTALEAAALAGLDPEACEGFAATIDPRLQRASLTVSPPARERRWHSRRRS